MNMLSDKTVKIFFILFLNQNMLFVLKGTSCLIEVVHALIQKVLSDWVQLLRFFCFVFLIRGGSTQIYTTIGGPSLARQQNAIKWHFAGVLIAAQH